MMAAGIATAHCFRADKRPKEVNIIDGRRGMPERENAKSRRRRVRARAGVALNHSL